MHSIRVGVFRPFARITAIATPLALIAMLMLPNAAFAATPIGSLGGNIPPCAPSPLGGLDLVQLSSTLPASYVVPTDGTITSWSTQTPAATGTGPTGLQVWRLVAGSNYRLVGATSPLVPLVENSLNFFPEAIPVLKGDLIGLRVEGPFVCIQSPSLAGDSLGYFIGPNPALNSVDAMTVYPKTAKLNVIATVEPAIPTGGGDGCDQSGAWSGNFICDQGTAAGV